MRRRLSCIARVPLARWLFAAHVVGGAALPEGFAARVEGRRLAEKGRSVFGPSCRYLGVCSDERGGTWGSATRTVCVRYNATVDVCAPRVGHWVIVVVQLLRVLSCRVLLPGRQKHDYQAP